MLKKEIQTWMRRNAREVELALWRCLFEGGSSEAVANALLAYQNEDGGFGHALEADNWNPGSTPITTDRALIYLRMAGYEALEHPAYQGVMRYVRSGLHRWEYGWMFTVPENNAYPGAPWWRYSEEENARNYAGVTAHLDAFILLHMQDDPVLYPRAQEEARAMLCGLAENETYGDKGLPPFEELLSAAEATALPGIDLSRARAQMMEKCIAAVRASEGHWHEYGVRPSDVVRTPTSPLYAPLKRLITEEQTFLLDTREKSGVWPITWTWYDTLPQYPTQFTLSESWWKSICAIENYQFLQAFGRG